MATPIEILKPFVTWCDTPPAVDPGDTHVARFTANRLGVPGLYYYGSLAYKVRGSASRPRFDGTAVGAVDPRDRFTPIPNFKDWFARVNIVMFPTTGKALLGMTFCEWEQLTFSAGNPTGPTIEADLIPFGDGTFNFDVDGTEWQLQLRKSTVRGF